MNNTQRVEAIQRADGVADLLAHVGWTESLKPALVKQRETFASMLVAAVLGKPDDKGLTKEQLAGRIQGLDFTIKLIEDILKRGTEALEALESQGFHLNSNQI